MANDGWHATNRAGRWPITCSGHLKVIREMRKEQFSPGSDGKATWMRGLAVFLAGVAGVATFVAWISLRFAPAQTSTGPPHAQDQVYAEPGYCAVCHPKISESYRQTGMGRSFYRPSSTTTAGSNGPNETFYHQPSDSYFTMLSRDGNYYQRRHQIDASGEQINVMEKRIDFILGSGNHARAYLHRTARNTLVELPLGWYAEKGGYLAMNPGYDRPDHDGFRRKISYDCMFCHNGYPKIPPGHDRPFAEPVYVDRLPEGIDCQRCHGPGRRHAELAQHGATVAAIRGAIVNPSRLSPERRNEVCIQCHLETTSFALPNSIQRYDRGPFAYRPGEPLSADWLFFDHAPGTGRDEKFEIVNSVYRLRRSKCYIASVGAMQCTSCHNPHEAPRGEAATRHYDAACRTCHGSDFNQVVAAGKHTGAAGCAGCHMPKRRTDDVVHAVATDHYIQRKKPAGNLLAEVAERHENPQSAYRGEVKLYYPQKLPPTAENGLYVALAQVIDKSNLKAGIEQLSSAIKRQPSARSEFYLGLAEAWQNNGQPDKSLSLYREAVRRNPQSTFALLKLGSALRRSGRLQEAVLVLNRAVEWTSNAPAIWNEIGLTYRAQGKTREAISSLKKAVALDPDLPEPHNNLGTLWLEQGDQTKAATDLREAIRIQPDFVDAHNNLANLLSEAGDFGQARSHFEIALRLRPGDVETRYNFAMALGRAKLYDEAQQQLEAAVQSDPNHADARQRLAEMLMAKGQTEAALQHYRVLLPLLRKAAASTDVDVREQAIQILRQIERD